MSNSFRRLMYMVLGVRPWGLKHAADALGYCRRNYIIYSGRRSMYSCCHWVLNLWVVDTSEASR